MNSTVIPLSAVRAGGTPLHGAQGFPGEALYPRLFSPLTIGSITLRNRIVMAPHGVIFAGGYGPGADRVVDYHIERAKGGAGLLVMSNFLMLPSWCELASWGGNLKTSPLGNLDLANDESMLPAYRRLVDGVRGNGARFISQLNASGRQLHSPGVINFGIPLLAPSAIPCPKTREIPREMTRCDIDEYIQVFADASANMLAAGADGVEVFAAQGYLISEFLSPNANHRSDAYGGLLINRMRFLLEIIQAIRSRVGRDFVVGVRLNSDDYEEGGVDLPMAREIAGTLAQTGLVDYFNISGMTNSLFPGWIGDINAPEAQFAGRAGAIKAAVDLPVCVASRIESAEQAEGILEAGQADMIGMARALISDPELPNKARLGRSEDVRKCTYSNQTCLINYERGRGVGCVHNVAVGKEAQLGIGTMRAAPRRKTVGIVGGGPAGLAAARIAAERGHTVTLFERATQLGGQNRMAATVKSRIGLAEVTRWQEHMLRKTGATIALGTSVDAGMLLAMGFDAIVLATGSVPSRDGYSTFRASGSPLPGAEQAHVFTSWEAFSRLDETGYRVIVIEEDPHFAGTAVAEHLAANGRSVHMITPHVHCGSQLPVNFVPDMYRRLAAQAIRMSPNTLVLSVTAESALCQDRYTLKEWREPIDSVILATGNRVEDTLQKALQGRHPEVHCIGDCLAPRQLDHAIVDGERIGWML